MPKVGLALTYIIIQILFQEMGNKNIEQKESNAHWH